jgi:hypothetical protein
MFSYDMLVTGCARAPARAGLHDEQAAARELNEEISVIEQYALHRRTAVTAAKVRVLTS